MDTFLKFSSAFVVSAIKLQNINTVCLYNVVANRVAPTVVANRVDPTVVTNRVAPTVVANRVDPTVVANRVAPTVVTNRVAPTVAKCPVLAESPRPRATVMQ